MSELKLWPPNKKTQEGGVKPPLQPQENGAQKGAETGARPDFFGGA